MARILLRRAVRHSILTAISLDVAGFALSSYAYRTRLDWCKSSRQLLPLHRSKSIYDNKGSFNTYFMLYLLDSFTEIKPVEEADLDEFQQSLYENLLRFGKSKRDRLVVPNKFEAAQDDAGVSLSVGSSLGYYAALTGASADYLLLLIQYVADCFVMTEDEVDSVRLLAFTIYRLCQAGYFGAEHIEEMLMRGVVPARLTELFEILSERYIDQDFYVAGCPNELIEDATYSQQVIGEAYYYMLRVSGAFSSKVKSLPKDQLMDLFVSDFAHPEDAGFVFGAICTASEQERLLISKDIREGLWYRKQVDELLRMF